MKKTNPWVCRTTTSFLQWLLVRIGIDEINHVAYLMLLVVVARHIDIVVSWSLGFTNGACLTKGWIDKCAGCTFPLFSSRSSIIVVGRSSTVCILTFSWTRAIAATRLDIVAWFGTATFRFTICFMSCKWTFQFIRIIRWPCSCCINSSPFGRSLCWRSSLGGCRSGTPHSSTSTSHTAAIYSIWSSSITATQSVSSGPFPTIHCCLLRLMLLPLAAGLMMLIILSVWKFQGMLIFMLIRTICTQFTRLFTPWWHTVLRVYYNSLKEIGKRKVIVIVIVARCACVRAYRVSGYFVTLERLHFHQNHHPVPNGNRHLVTETRYVSSILYHCFHFSTRRRHRMTNVLWCGGQKASPRKQNWQSRFSPRPDSFQ